ncbi:LiaI-LiaF-like domain-containing protein [Virgibacillus sp. W0181]|uniref:LiaI-LiaF-like domain-containing protein n=1 Tax=Virgibacillus sp. W0181 TaxID=3391581 RepID=UPI003F45FC6F
MKKQNVFTAYVLIGTGVYFLIEQLQLSVFQNFYSWPTFLIIIGIAFLLHSYSTREYANLFTGTLLLGLGIHFHGLQNYSFWLDHWAVYPMIVGIAFLVRYLRTKRGLWTALILISISVFMIFSENIPEWLQWIYYIIDFIKTFWPIVLIVFGLYLLKRHN